MNKSTRRQFGKTCLVAALSGLSVTSSGCIFGCRREENAGPPIGGTTQEEQDLLHTTTDAKFEPPYLELHRTGELKARGEQLWKIMAHCELCPRRCGVNKLEGEKGFCQANAQLQISAFQPHHGEELPLRGQGGSGTIFLTNCGLRCVFCCNWEISQGGDGEDKRLEDMADMMLHLQKIGCHNINFVTPTHYSPHIVRAVNLAAGRGLKLPLVYNTCGWERPEILKMLDGIVDIYLPDFKYSDGAMAAKYSSEAETYPEITQEALLEMHRQVGVAKPAKDGLMYRGLMIRHLIMPNEVSGTKKVVEWIAENLPKDTYVNIMSQYTPLYKAKDYPMIARRITRKEYRDAVRWAKEAGLTNLDLQGERM
jgi:putative pyruvate formate lyase activating enzyme